MEMMMMMSESTSRDMRVSADRLYLLQLLQGTPTGSTASTDSATIAPSLESSSFPDEANNLQTSPKSSKTSNTSNALPRPTTTVAFLTEKWSAQWQIHLQAAVHNELSKTGHSIDSWRTTVSPEMLSQLRLIAGIMSIETCAHLTIQEFHVRVAGGSGYVIVKDLEAAYERFIGGLLRDTKRYSKSKPRAPKAPKRLPMTVSKLKKKKRSKRFGGLTSPRDTPEREYFESPIRTEPFSGERRAIKLEPNPSAQLPPTPEPESTPILAPRVPTDILLKCAKIFPPYDCTRPPRRSTYSTNIAVNIKPEQRLSTSSIKIHPTRAASVPIIKSEPQTPNTRQPTEPQRSERANITSQASTRNVFLPHRRSQSISTISSTQSSPNPPTTGRKKSLKFCRTCQTTASFYCSLHTKKRARNQELSIKGF